MAAMTWLRCIILTAAMLVAVATFVKAKCDTTGSACIRSCTNKENGDYQSCDGCHEYVTCSNGIMYGNRPCPGRLVWNDKKHMCSWTSRSCKCVVLPMGPAIDGQWSEWDPWSQCTASCDGGLQQRERRCDDPEPENGGADCVGMTADSRPCNVWDCPDCSKQCPVGSILSLDCSQCLCADAVVEGRVTDSTTSLGLADVNIYTVGKEWSPTVVSERDGKFTISGVCKSGMKLTVRKHGYESAKREYIVIPGSSVSITMYRLEKPTFTEEPQSTAGFVGGKASFSCQATAEPAVIQYDWFKDGNIVAVDGSSVYEINNLKKADEGQYACRAASLGGKVFSRLAGLVVKEAGAIDTCDANPQELTVELPPTCRITVNGASVTSINVGRCSNVPCVTRAEPNKVNYCCGPSSTRQLHVVCTGFNYDINQVVSCGCTECDKDPQVTITGDVRTGGQPFSDIYAFYEGVKYYVEDEQFTFEATQQAGRVSFQVKSPSYMPRQVSLDVMPGVTEMFVDVSLTPRPQPNTVDPAAESELPIASDSLSTAVSVTIPANSFQDANGNPVSGDVSVYLTFADPRQFNGLDSAPGEFTFEDDEGETRLLQTFGVVSLVAEDSDGNEVFLTGKTTMKFDAQALGMKPGEKVMLWSIDETSGQWKESGEFTYATRRRRRDINNGTIVEGETEIPPNVPYINFDKPVYRKRLCFLSAYVYYGAAFSVPLPGERISVFLMQNGLFFGRTSGYTDQNGRACLIVLCGLRVIVRLETGGPVMVHPVHFLPIGFPFTNRADGFELIPAFPTGTNGPVYRKGLWNAGCYASTSTDYHFMLAKTPLRPALYGSLNAVEMRPGFDNSWYPNPPANREVCALRMVVLTTEAMKMKVVGISRSPDGILYGTYTAILNKETFRDYKRNSGNEMEAYGACVLIRCPMNKEYTAVDLQIAYENRTQCRLSYTQLRNDRVNGLTKYVSSTNSSIQVRVLSEDDDISSSGEGYDISPRMKRAVYSREDYGIGLYHATGAGDLAFYRVMTQCRTRGWNVVARFDCVGSGGDTTTKPFSDVSIFPAK